MMVRRDGEVPGENWLLNTRLLGVSRPVEGRKEDNVTCWYDRKPMAVQKA